LYSCPIANHNGLLSASTRPIVSTSIATTKCLGYLPIYPKISYVS
jgi:hypothetical protein